MTRTEITVRAFKKEIKKELKQAVKAKDINTILSKKVYGLAMYWHGICQAYKYKMFTKEETDKLQEYIVNTAIKLATRYQRP